MQPCRDMETWFLGGRVSTWVWLTWSWAPPGSRHRHGCCRSAAPVCCTSSPRGRMRCTHPCRCSRPSCEWWAAGPPPSAASSAPPPSGPSAHSPGDKRPEYSNFTWKNAIGRATNNVHRNIICMDCLIINNTNVDFLGSVVAKQSTLLLSCFFLWLFPPTVFEGSTPNQCQKVRDISVQCAPFFIVAHWHTKMLVPLRPQGGAICGQT